MVEDIFTTPQQSFAGQEINDSHQPVAPYGLVQSDPQEKHIIEFNVNGAEAFANTVGLRGFSLDFGMAYILNGTVWREFVLFC